MIKHRAFTALNIKQFNSINKPELVLSNRHISIPKTETYVLRVLIKHTFSGYKIPKDLEWVTPLVYASDIHQYSIGITQPFCYLTVRSTDVPSRNNDDWHVDGFSTRITHLPEQNYLWSDHTPTECVTKKLKFPNDFNPLKHNIHLFFQDSITESDKIQTLKPCSLYCMDPYVIHRRPKVIVGRRTVIRISHTPIEIADSNNTINPLLLTNYTRDGIKDFRDKLERYKV